MKKKIVQHEYPLCKNLRDTWANILDQNAGIIFAEANL